MMKIENLCKLARKSVYLYEKGVISFCPGYAEGKDVPSVHLVSECFDSFFYGKSKIKARFVESGFGERYIEISTYKNGVFFFTLIDRKEALYDKYLKTCSLTSEGNE